MFYVLLDLDGFKRFQGVIDGFIQAFGIDKWDTHGYVHVYCEEIEMGL